MSRESLGVLAAAFAVACSFSSPGGKGDGVATIAGSADGDGGSGSSTAGDDEGASAAASTGTGDPGGGTFLFDTGEPVDPDDSDTGVLGSTSLDLTTGSDGPIDPTIDPVTDDGIPPDPPYRACPSGEDGECGDGSHCAQTTNQWGGVTGSVCGETGCTTGGDCPAPTGGTAQPFCAGLEPPMCVLGCNDGTMCPAGMTCTGTQLGNVCVWSS